MKKLTLLFLTLLSVFCIPDALADEGNYPLTVTFPANGYTGIYLSSSKISANDYKSVTVCFKDEVSTSFSININDAQGTATQTNFFSSGKEKTVDFAAYVAEKNVTDINNVFLLSAAPASDATVVITNAYLTRNDGTTEKLVCTNLNATSFEWAISDEHLPLIGCTATKITNTATGNFCLAYTTEFQPFGFTDVQGVPAISGDYTGYSIKFRSSAAGAYRIELNDNESTSAEYFINNPSGVVTGTFGAAANADGNFTLKSNEITRFWFQRMWATETSKAASEETPRYVYIAEAYFIKSDGSHVDMLPYGKNEKASDDTYSYGMWYPYAGKCTLEEGDMAFRYDSINVTGYKYMAINFAEPTTAELTLQLWNDDSGNNIVSKTIPAGTSGDFIYALPDNATTIPTIDLLNHSGAATFVNIDDVRLQVSSTTGINAITNNTASSSKDNAVYNMQGIRMNGNNLPSGIYIKNGKKFIAK